MDSAIASSAKFRRLEERDLSRLKELFTAQNFEYSIPDLDVFLQTVAVEVEGSVELAIAARPTVELYLFGNPQWGTPGQRLSLIKQAGRILATDLHSIGIQDAHAWVPPQIYKSFGRRLIKEFDAIQSKWPCFTLFTGRVK